MHRLSAAGGRNAGLTYPYNSAWVDKGGVYEIRSHSSLSLLIQTLNNQAAMGGKVVSFRGMNSNYVAFFEQACP